MKYYCYPCLFRYLSRGSLQCGIYGIDMGYRYTLYIHVVEHVGIYLCSRRSSAFDIFFFISPYTPSTVIDCNILLLLLLLLLRTQHVREHGIKGRREPRTFFATCRNAKLVELVFFVRY